MTTTIPIWEQQGYLARRTGIEKFLIGPFLLLLLSSFSYIYLDGYYYYNEIWSLILSLFAIASFYVVEMSNRPPKNDIANFVAAGIRKSSIEMRRKRGGKNKTIDEEEEPFVLLCLGDSLTHGACSANYVDGVNEAVVRRLTEELRRGQSIDTTNSLRRFKTINAGQNSICTYTILHERIQGVIACQPDYVTVLIGSNDIRGIYRKDWGKQISSMWNFPKSEFPSWKCFERNLHEIINQLFQGLPQHARIGLCTLPPMGEDLTSKANHCVSIANDIIHRLVDKYNSADNNIPCTTITTGGAANTISRSTITTATSTSSSPLLRSSIRGRRIRVVDINKALVMSIRTYAATTTASSPASHARLQRKHSVDHFLSAAMWMAYGYHLLGFSWTKLSNSIANTVLSDSLHLNEVGANIVTKEIVKWIIEQEDE